MPDWSTAEWAQVIAASGAAVAALAASAAAWVSLSQQRGSKRPNVSAGVLHDPSSGRLELAFQNGGPGIAVQLGYMLVNGPDKRGGLVEAGHLGVGENARVDPQVTADTERSYLVWMCSDVDWNVYIWSSEWEEKRFSRRRWLRRKDKSLNGAFVLMHPSVAIP